MAHDFGPRPGLIDAKQAWGTANYIDAPAMSSAACAAALARGAELVRDYAARGGNVLGLGQGRSKREAGQKAAQEALSQLDADATLS